jgi:glycosyltransferase involved in cell wall biosynthesis
MQVDEALFTPAGSADRLHLRRSFNLSGQTVIGVGRLVPIKGFDVLVRAVARLAITRRPTLVLAGEGPSRESLALQAIRLGVDLRLPGMLDRRSLVDWLRASDLYVHPSRTLPNGRREGMPLGPREALCVGLPVVASLSGGLTELAGCDARVTVVPPDNPGALSAALRRALDCADGYAGNVVKCGTQVRSQRGSSRQGDV